MNILLIINIIPVIFINCHVFIILILFMFFWYLNSHTYFVPNVSNRQNDNCLRRKCVNIYKNVYFRPNEVKLDTNKANIFI